MRVLKGLLQKLYVLIYNILYFVSKTNSNLIIFESNLGKNYSGNPKAIYEGMVDKGLDKKYTCIWVFNDTNQQVKGKHITIKRMRLKYLYYYAVAGTWIVDSRQPLFIKKRKNVILVQTWHGTPLKKLGLDMEVLNMGGETDLKGYQDRFKLSSSRWDYLISQNKYSSDIFRSAFGYDKSILETGYPRNDILVNANDYDNILKLKKKLNIPLDKKVMLYAPTWRDNAFHKKGQYKFSTNIDIQKIHEEFNKDFILLVKAHYLVVDALNTDAYSGFVYKFGNEQDIAELYLVSDMLITDYSSVMFDYSVLRRRMIFYVYDIEEYRDSLRGFYLPFEEYAPGPLVKTMPQLVDAIRLSDEEYQEKYSDKYKKFTNKFNYRDDGRASDRVIEKVILRK
jgi:CDP-glycerol glycerophosphotransferase